MLGGQNPGKGAILVDSGACFTMVTELFAERHGYIVKPFKSSFSQAAPGGPPGEIIGAINMEI